MMHPLAKSFSCAAILWLPLLPILLLLPLLSSCTSDTYEKGTGKYSRMQADMAELTIDKEQQAVSFVTDDGEEYRLSPTFKAQWIQTADTIYRAIIYYNRNDDGTAQSVSAGSVPTLRPREHWRFKNLPQDPVGMESAWLSRNKKYLNMGLLIKSGYTTDSTAIHSIALSQDTIYSHDDGSRTAVYTFIHSQGGVPEYFTDRRFVSILLPDEPADTVVLNIQTYNGPLTRRFSIE